ncbi:unnamed protein product [Rotaria sordida]|uniref:Uncharacterized protein n=1 Tax=Rotaria sordida TaxID=392033 RepID=A0A815WNU5_9BILA|nr:unnamed protein product [Rotaria sordida]CAF4209627.1 unnamed protein product [Rotaria sordida]
MASNFTGSSNVATENYPLPSQPEWIVPTNSITTSGKTVLSSNNDIELQAFKGSATMSPSNIDDILPNYFDTSVVPDDAVLYYNDVNPYTEASKAEIKRNEKGILSFDLLINNNTDQLWLYFMTYLNEKPQLKVNIRGYYITVFLPLNNYFTKS